uniref:Uncharacterized LOC100184213 n=1 Tax=Ciona intestinalis TaxID=7719 RepID=F6URX9_CIOIN|nr:uncharacterized protein LOC100184213 [Ciona intestinalis]|eukprot:XP_002129584.1 uncharacterized protein LOC100184213 [Ciona intestinalis]
MSRNSVGIDRGLITSRDGVFKGIILVVSLVGWILILASNPTHFIITQIATYVSFSLGFTFVTMLISLFIYFLQLYSLPLCNRAPWKLLEVVYSIVLAVINFIGMCIAAAVAARLSNTGQNEKQGLNAACAVLSAFVTVMFLIYALMVFRGEEPRSVKTTHSATNVPT